MARRDSSTPASVSSNSSMLGDPCRGAGSMSAGEKGSVQRGPVPSRSSVSGAWATSRRTLTGARPSRVRVEAPCDRVRTGHPARRPSEETMSTCVVCGRSVVTPASTKDGILRHERCARRALPLPDRAFEKSCRGARRARRAWQEMMDRATRRSNAVTGRACGSGTPSSAVRGGARRSRSRSATASAWSRGRASSGSGEGRG